MRDKYCLSQKELARRWGISHRTLERWRYLGQGPAFLKLGGRILYRFADIENFEQSQLQRELTGRESSRQISNLSSELQQVGSRHKAPSAC